LKTSCLFGRFQEEIKRNLYLLFIWFTGKLIQNLALLQKSDEPGNFKLFYHLLRNIEAFNPVYAL